MPGFLTFNGLLFTTVGFANRGGSSSLILVVAIIGAVVALPFFASMKLSDLAIKRLVLLADTDDAVPIVAMRSELLGPSLASQREAAECNASDLEVAHVKTYDRCRATLLQILYPWKFLRVVLLLTWVAIAIFGRP
jgi:hypothetical protein